MKKLIILLSLFFVFSSFFPTLYELYYAKNLPKDRAFEAVHNYMFDYNFYLSRIREGQEGKWLVTEKYYNKPHSASLFQIVYLYLGKLGGLFSLSPPFIYHTSRVIFGLTLLLIIGKLVVGIFPGWWSVVSYLLIVTAGSWPILVKLGNFWRFSAHWGGWSVIDPLARITFIPHVLLGQIFLVLIIWRFSGKSLKLPTSLKWGAIGLIAGIIFPPVLIVIYTIFIVMTVIEYLFGRRVILVSEERAHPESKWDPGQARMTILPKIIFVIFSLPALLYLQIMFKVDPWHALSVFDIQHRSILPYWEYVLTLGPILPLGLAGLIIALIKKEKKFFPFISWILALGLLFLVFEHVPEQSPTRFTQMLINAPLGILSTYFFYQLWGKLGRRSRWGMMGVIGAIILMGLGVMFSTLGWQIDQVGWKSAGTWLYPVGTELVYPLKDFMDGINYLKINTKTSDVVLAYEAAGNYIPAYAGNFVYLGHANTPDEDEKLKIAAKFFKGEMDYKEAKDFLQKENIKYIYYGPQEREWGGINNLQERYFSLVSSVYTNNQVTIYKISNY